MDIQAEASKFVRGFESAFSVLEVPVELRDNPEVQRYVLLYTIAQQLWEELSREADKPKPWHVLPETQDTDAFKLAEYGQPMREWHKRCSALALLMSSVC